MRASAEPMVRRWRRKAKRVVIPYKVRMRREKEVDREGASSGRRIRMCITRRLGKKVRSFVNGVIPTVTKLSRTLIQREGCAYEGPVFLDFGGGAREMAR